MCVHDTVALTHKWLLLTTVWLHQWLSVFLSAQWQPERLMGGWLINLPSDETVTHIFLSLVWGMCWKLVDTQLGQMVAVWKLEHLVVAAEEEGSRVWLGRCWFTEAGPRLATCRGVCEGVCEGGWVGRWWWSCKGSLRAALWSCVKCSVSGEGL